MNYDDLLVMYGKRAQKLDLYRAKLLPTEAKSIIMMTTSFESK